VVALRTGYVRINHKRESTGSEGGTDAEMSELGDKAPTFRYML